MANVVVQAAAAAPNVIKVVQPGIAASNVVQSVETRGTITVNAAVAAGVNDITRIPFVGELLLTLIVVYAVDV